MTLGEKLQRLRKARGMSQEELAGMLSVTRQTVSKWERGQSSPELEYISQLSDLFGVTADYLIKPTDANTDFAVLLEAMSAERMAAEKEEERKTRYTFLTRLCWWMLIGGLGGMLLIYFLSVAFPVQTMGMPEGLFSYLQYYGLWPVFSLCLCAALAGGIWFLIICFWPYDN